MYGRPTCTVSYIRRVGTDPDLVLRLTRQKIERRSLKVAVNCCFLMLFFLASASCSVFGFLTIDLSPLQSILESVDLAVSAVGLVLGIYGLFLSMRTDFKPVEQYRTISLYFGVLYCLLFAMKVVIEGFDKTDVLSLFECEKTVTAASVYSLLLVILVFSVAKFVTQVKKFGADLVQLNAHTIPLLNSKSVLGGP